MFQLAKVEALKHSSRPVLIRLCNQTKPGARAGSRLCTLAIFAVLSTQASAGLSGEIQQQVRLSTWLSSHQLLSDLGSVSDEIQLHMRLSPWLNSHLLLSDSAGVYDKTQLQLQFSPLPDSHLLLLHPVGVSSETQLQMRLSPWLDSLMQQPVVETNPHHKEVFWTDPKEKEAQQKDKDRLLGLMKRHELSPAVPAEAEASLRTFVERLAVTGRVVLERTDPRWLEVHPDKDPVLEAGQRVSYYDRPDTVSVVFGDGRVCQTRHDATRYARDYIRACDASSDPVQAWIVQPDGVVQLRKVASWNMETQDTPAPGAWILAEETRYAWNADIYEQLARLLATQGPAQANMTVPGASAPSNVTTILSDLIEPVKPVDLILSGSDWGSVGLLQTPSARMYPAGTGTVSLSRVQPYTRLNFVLQPFDWLEASFRYTSISNRLYGSTIAGSQSFKDKSADFKLKLAKETELRPELALGIRDLGGTGLFSGEYLVASKRSGNLDWSLGLGWGYVGARGNLGNPFSIFGSTFNTRPLPTTAVASAGKVSLNNLFHGSTSLFGGVQYQTPWNSLVLKLEYDGNDYQHEPQGNNQSQKVPFNIGAIYRYSDNLDLNIGLERGDTVMLGANFHGRLDRLKTPKLNDPKPVPVSPLYPQHDPDWSALAGELEATTGWRVNQIRRAGGELIVRFDEVDAYYWNDYLDRIVSLLHRDVSTSSNFFRIQGVDKDLRVNEYIIDREAWVEAKTRLLPPHERRNTVLAYPYQDGFKNKGDTTLFSQPFKQFSGDYGTYFEKSVGGPNGFLLYQLGAQFTGTWRFKPDTWFTGIVNAKLIDNFDNFAYTAPTGLPRVRTYVREYMTSSEVMLPFLQMTHVGRLNRDQYYSLYGGMLEPMFGGVGGEWLYRPYGSKLAFGVDVNAVRQRAFEQNLSFCDTSVYTGCVGETTTGHASVYWDTGFQDVLATIQVGRYLAGDYGATLDLARRFSNGVKMGAWVTKTNVSAAQFGEGSFDKGIYVTIPFDAITTRSGGSYANLVWQPLTRDGGARLSRGVRLIDLTRDADGQSLMWGPADDDRKTQFGDTHDRFGQPYTRKSAIDAAREDLLHLGSSLNSTDFWGGALLAGGLTVVSSVFDKKADSVAVKNGSRSIFRAAEKVGDVIPFLAMGLSGALLLKDDEPTQTRASFASLEAGGMAAMTVLGAKYVVDRARPISGQGAYSFGSGAGGNSSFPSMHSAVAWATLTPYAKAYDAPWLYGVAAITSAARVGERNHWFSDTVAGALIGYGLGSLFWESRSLDKDAPSLYVSAGKIGLVWNTQ